MIRILINWDFVSPSMKTARGTVSVHSCPEVLKFNELIKFKVSVTSGSTGYHSFEGKCIPSKILDAVRPKLDLMVRAYLNGVCLSDTSYSWFIDEDETFAYDAFKEIEQNPDKYKNMDKGIKTITERKGCKG